MAHRAQNSVGLLFLAKQALRQFRDLHRDPSRFVARERLDLTQAPGVL